MKKIYSIVLMATALLIGTNAWGQTSTVQLVNQNNASKSKNYATLQAAIDAIAPGEYGTITLLDEQNLTAQVVIPNVMGEDDATYTARGPVVGRPLQHITLDLNGFDINGADKKSCIALVKGELHITGEGTITKNGTYAGNFGSWDRAAIVVGGAAGDKDTPANDHSKEWWSILTIDEHVKLYSAAPKTMGLSIANIGSTTYGANGNNIEDATAAWLGTYAKLGYLTYSKATNRNTMWSTSAADEQGSAFGVKIVVKGEIYGERRGVNVLGHVNQHPSSFPETGTHKETRKRYTIGNEHPYYYEHYFPWITLTPTAKVHCVETGITGDEACGIYSAGWAVLDISGAVYGQNGAYLKGGDLELNDANVYSTSSVGQNSGVANANCSGNGIFVSTDNSYAHDITIEVNGDSRIAGKGGVAITDVVASVTTTPDVNFITINGGTIEGGSLGAIVVTENTGDKTVAYGGTNITGATTKGGTESSVAASGTYATEVTDPVTNKTTIVISDLGAGNSVETVTENLAQTTEDYVKWTGTADQYILDDKTLEYLEMNPSPAVAQKIYVGDATHQVTLTVDRVVMGSLAQIIVAPGSKLIITGTDGIVAPVFENIQLQASSTDQAVFLFNPNVKSNRHPNATVQMYAMAHHATDGTWYAQHFGIPTFKTPIMTFAPGNTYVYKWTETGWENITSLSQLKPFIGYRINNTSETAAGVYTFKGELNGNTDAPLQFVKPEYNLVANSYAAPMDLAAMFTDIQDQYGNAVELTAWIYKSAEDRHVSITQASVASNEDPEAIKTIAPMQGFILYCGASQPADGTISYEEAVWNNPNKTGVPIMAPARNGNDNSIRATIVVSTEKSKDEVILRESNDYSSAFDNGADAHKYMSERVFDLYSENNGENYSNVATDNLDGTKLTLQAKNETAYTMSFRNVNNFNYAIRDNMSGAIIPVEEGATYNFSMAEGTIANDRFEIVKVNAIMTAIDNVEATRAAKGIYTILGQYVGESSILNTLPSGIYVVDGQRIVK